MDNQEIEETIELALNSSPTSITINVGEPERKLLSSVVRYLIFKLKIVFRSNMKIFLLIS